MAAGDLVVQDWQIELRARLMGDASAIIVDSDRGGLGGLLDLVTEEPEMPYAHQKGSFIGDSREVARTVTAALVTDAATAAAANLLIWEMRTIWAGSNTDEQLWFQLPGIGKGYVVGRPKGIVPLPAKTVLSGAQPFMATFRLGDPTVYLVP